MSQASDYPVTFKFGATTAPYSPSSPHTGSDHAMPKDTPINVGNTIIGYAGTTGKSTGFHVHVQKYKGGYLDPGSAGFANTIPFPARVSEVGYRDDIGNFVRLVDAASVRWSYFHMTKQNVAVGQIINAYVAAPAPQGDKKMNDSEEQDAYQIVLQRPRDIAPTGRSGIAFIRDARNELSQQRAAINNQLSNLSAQIAVQNQTITDLTEKLKSSDASSAEKQQALNDAIKNLKACTTEFETTHKQLEDLQKPAEPAPESASLFIKLAASVARILTRNKTT